ncbi:DUF92 domain-containing protein [Mucilaginibacter sp. HD30]
MQIAEIVVYVILLLGGICSYATGKLTPGGSLTGGCIGLVIFKGGGLPCFVMLTFFFVIASAATKWQREKKVMMNAAEQSKGRRNAAQVLANGGVAALLGLWGWLQPGNLSLTELMIAGSIAAATADTLSSELGTVYGRRFYNIITLKKDTRGLDGVISLEGTLIGIAGASAIAAIHCIGFGWNERFIIIILAGFTGNLVDSVLGAWLERKRLIGNNVVNFLNTAAGGGICWIFMASNL